MKNAFSLVVICAALGCGAVGCGAEGGGSASSSASAGATGSAKPADKKDAAKDEKKDEKKDAPKQPATKLTKKQLDDGYDAGFGMAMMKEPLDKKLAAVEAKLGAPAKSDADSKTWYGLDGDKCSEMKLNLKDGTSVVGSTDKASCGL